MALTKVSAAMFSTAAQTSDLNLDDGTLFVDASENKVAIGNTAPAEALDITGNLTLRARGYLKLQDDAGGQFVAIRAPATVSSSVTYTFPAADGSSGQSLTTDGSGTLSWSAAAPTAGTGVTVSGSQVSIGQAVATSDSPTFTNLTLSGNLTVNGSTVTNSATNTTIEDLLIELGTGTSGSPSSDAGIVIERGSSDNVFMGWDESADVIVLGTGSFTGASSGNLTITPATLHVGSVGIGNPAPDVSLDIGSKTDAVHLPVGTTAQRPGSPAAGYFRYNSTLGKFEGYTTSWGEIGGGGGSTTLNTDLFTGNGSTVDFTISQAIDNENKLMVFIDGVYQNPDAYSMPANTTLRFTAAPANGRKIAVYSVAGVVSGTNLNIDSFTGDGSDLTFTLSITPVSENNTLVYVGGVYQQKSVYSVSGTTLTFGSGNAPPNGASIEVATFNQTDINVPVDNTITTAKIVNDAVTADKIVDNIALPGNITTTGTLTPTGVLTANAGVVVDNITIDGTEIDLSNGSLTIDAHTDIILDADSGVWRFKDDGTTLLQFAKDGATIKIYSAVSDADMIFQGNDGGSTVNALILDMSAGGNATFISNVTAGKFLAATSSTTDSVLTLTDGGVADYEFTFPDTGTIQLGTSTSSNKELKLLNAGSGMFGLNVEGHILPAVNNTYSLGSSSARYYQVWASTNMISPTYIATGNVTTGGYQLTNTNGDGKPAITSDGNNWTIIRPIISGGDVAINNFANTANLFTITDEGNVGLNENTPTSYYSKTFQINGSGNTSAIKLTNTSTGNENGRGMDISSDVTNLRIVNREVGAIELYTGPVGSPALGLSVDTNGHVRMPKQPCAGVSSADQSLPANLTTLVFDTERFDLNSDFDVSTYKFNAPTTGKYLVTVNLYLKVIDNAAGYYQLYIVSDNKTYYSIFDPNLSDDANYWDMTWSAIIDMDENDKVYFRMNQSGGTAQTIMDAQSYASFVLVA